MKKIRAYLKNESRRWQLYVLILIPFIYVIIFKYIPIYGIQIAFKNFSLTKGIIQSEWVGLKYFKIFFNSYQFSRVLTNTLAISIIGLIVSFPFPVLLALSLNQVQKRSFKKTVQMVTYAPHFISTVVLVGMVLQFLDTRSGFVNKFIGIFGIDSINFMANPNFFLPIYIFSGIWQNVGYGSIIFLAALSSVDVQLYEAATIDGANKLQKIWHIDIPALIPTIVILLILNVGRTMEVGFEKVFLLQNPLNLSASEVISTYVYKTGLASAQYSYAAAIGVFNSVVNFILLVGMNRLAKSLKTTSLW